MSFPLTPLQLQCLPIVRGLVADKPWLPVSYVFAHVRIESGWEPAVVSTDGFGSIGLMQVLPAVAADRGFIGQSQADSSVSLATGIAQLAWGRAFLLRKWGFHSVKYHPVCEGYNEGYEGVIEGRQDSRYWIKWTAAQQSYAFIDMDV